MEIIFTKVQTSEEQEQGKRKYGKLLSKSSGLGPTLYSYAVFSNKHI